MVRSVLRETGLFVAFILLGALLLLTVWLSKNVESQILREYKQNQVSLILKPMTDVKLRSALAGNRNVVKVEFFSTSDNKERVGSVYPELRNVLQPLDAKFFPSSAVVTVKDVDAFRSTVVALGDMVDSVLFHEAPKTLQIFFQILSAVFFMLWLLTLSVVLYFNLERLSAHEEPVWSLMKMLGAKADRVFFKLWYTQAWRVGLASFFAAISFIALSKQVEVLFSWQWEGLSPMLWISFFGVSLTITFVISVLLFRSRYSRLSLG